MSVFLIIARSVFAMVAILVGGVSYIYVTKGLGGDTFLGVCSFLLVGVFSAMVYYIGVWISGLSIPPPRRLAIPVARRSNVEGNEVAEQSVEITEEAQDVVSVEADRQKLVEDLKRYTQFIFGDYLGHLHNSVDKNVKLYLY